MTSTERAQEERAPFTRDELVADLGMLTASRAAFLRPADIEAILDRLVALGWGPMPAGVLRVDRRLSGEELEKLKAAFSAQGTGKLYVLDDGPRPAAAEAAPRRRWWRR